MNDTFYLYICRFHSTAGLSTKIKRINYIKEELPFYKIRQIILGSEILNCVEITNEEFLFLKLKCNFDIRMVTIESRRVVYNSAYNKILIEYLTELR